MAIAKMPTSSSPQTDAGRLARKLSLDAMRDWEGIHNAHWARHGRQDRRPPPRPAAAATHAKACWKRTFFTYAELLDAMERRSEHVGKVLDDAPPPTGHGDTLIDAETRAPPSARRSSRTKSPRWWRLTRDAVATPLPDGWRTHWWADDATHGTPLRAHLQARSRRPMRIRELRRAMKVAGSRIRELNKRANAMID